MTPEVDLSTLSAEQLDKVCNPHQEGVGHHENQQATALRAMRGSHLPSHQRMAAERVDGGL